MLDRVEDVLRVTQNSDTAVSVGMAAARYDWAECSSAGCRGIGVDREFGQGYWCDREFGQG